MKACILFITLSLCFLQATAVNYGGLLQQTHAARYPFYNELYAEIIAQKDSNAAFQIIENVRSYINEHHLKQLSLEPDLLQLYYLTSDQPHQKHRILQAIHDLQEKIDKKDDLLFEARFASIAGNYYWETLNNYELAFDCFLKIYELQKNWTVAEFPDKPGNLYRLGECHYFFHDYTSTISYLKEMLALKSDSFGSYLTLQATNTIGLCYRQSGNLDSADHYFQLIYNHALKTNNAAWAGISAGNLAYRLVLQEKYDEAIPLLDQDLETSIARSDYRAAASAQLMLSQVSLSKNNLPATFTGLSRAREYLEKDNDLGLLKNYYALLARYYGTNGSGHLASAYMDSAFNAYDSLTRKYSALQLLRAQQKNELQKHQTELTRIDQQKKLKVWERNMMIVLLVLGFITWFYMYSLQKRRSEARRLILDAQLKKAAHELEVSHIQLQEFARNISEKNRLLEEIQAQIGTSNETIVAQLQQKTILTDEEWEHFRQLFEQVHSGYLARLKQKLPGLTPAEIRFMTLAKMQFSNKEMAGALGVSAQAIRTTWYRLRKKLNLPEEGNLEELVAEI